MVFENYKAYIQVKQQLQIIFLLDLSTLELSKLCNPFTSLINSSIEQGVFSSDLKSRGNRDFKKGDARNKANGRPVSVLSCISKICESILIDQLDYYQSTYVNKNVNMVIAENGYSCQTVLTDFVETSKTPG